jgi:hypothetical protein
VRACYGISRYLKQYPVGSAGLAGCQSGSCAQAAHSGYPVESGRNKLAGASGKIWAGGWGAKGKLKPRFAAVRVRIADRPRNGSRTRVNSIFPARRLAHRRAQDVG